MQFYIHAGFGFSGEHLNEAQAEALWQDSAANDTPAGEVEMCFVPFTEDYEAACWGSVIAMDFGKIPGGKLLTQSTVDKLKNRHPLTPELLAKMTQVLSGAGLAHLADKLELVYYPCNY